MVTEYVLGNINNKYWITNRRLMVRQVSRDVSIAKGKMQYIFNSHE